ncbi:MAG: 2-oxo acid dehydrogenase subunit E2 [Candidatus Obscuribacterales bacterium]|nr:2-oxo acid dehydrogenase subunit E2 [Candidatus Obscuribacterales bacterium]
MVAKKGKPNFRFSALNRARWNLLDMVGVVGKGSVPTYLFLDIDMTWAEDLRAQYNQYGIRITATALLLKAIAIAQRTHPDTRTVMLPFGRTAVFNDIVAGFTVERFIESEPALFFGAIEEPDTKSVADISKELKGYSEADYKDVRQLDLQNKFTGFPWLLRQIILWIGMRHPAFRLRCMGATFGLSSLGKFGLSAMIPPCVTTSTFGIGTIEQRPIVRDGKIEVRNMMTLTLNFDHRMLDGAPAARFLQDIRKLMEGGLEKYIQEELRELGSAVSEFRASLAPAEQSLTTNNAVL